MKTAYATISAEVMRALRKAPCLSIYYGDPSRASRAFGKQSALNVRPFE